MQTQAEFDNHELLIVHGYEFHEEPPQEHSTPEDGILGVDPSYCMYTSSTEYLFSYKPGRIIDRNVRDHAYEAYTEEMMR